MNAYILTHDECSRCVFGEQGQYNAICAHCTYCTYSKEGVHFMTRETAELVGAIKKKDE